MEWVGLRSATTWGGGAHVCNTREYIEGGAHECNIMLYTGSQVQQHNGRAHVQQH